jgi:hypothetical protein
MAEGLQSWNEAQREIDAACILLIDPTPENLDRCTVLLHRAVSALSNSRSCGKQACVLRASVQRVGRLLETAAAYHRHWLKILRSMTAGCYTADGDLTSPPAPGRVSMEG